MVVSMNKDEALKLALEALRQIDEAMPFPIAKLAQKVIKEALAQPEHGWTPERIAGIARLKEAQDKKLAQPEQEPVAYIKTVIEALYENSDPVSVEAAELLERIYTPPQRKPLTDKELNLIGAQWHYNLLGKDDKAELFAFARAIEAAHGIKGEA